MKKYKEQAKSKTTMELLHFIHGVSLVKNLAILVIFVLMLIFGSSPLRVSELASGVAEKSKTVAGLGTVIVIVVLFVMAQVILNHYGMKSMAYVYEVEKRAMAFQSMVLDADSSLFVGADEKSRNFLNQHFNVNFGEQTDKTVIDIETDIKGTTELSGSDEDNA